MSFALWKLKIILWLSFLDKTMVGSMVYFNLTIFLRIPLLSKMRYDDLSALILFTLFFTELIL